MVSRPLPHQRSRLTFPIAIGWALCLTQCALLGGYEYTDYDVADPATAGTSGSSGTAGNAGNSGTPNGGNGGTSGTTAGSGGDSGTSGSAGQTGGQSGTDAGGSAGTQTGGMGGTAAGGTGAGGTGAMAGTGGIAGSGGAGGSGTAGTGATGAEAGQAGTAGSAGDAGSAGTAGTAGSAGSAGSAGTGATAGTGGTGGCPSETTWYRDYDFDTWGGDLSPIMACEKPADVAEYNWVDRNGDCDDTNDLVHPQPVFPQDPVVMYHTTGYPKVGAAGGVSFDYDCDGAETPPSNEVVETCDMGNCSIKSGYESTMRTTNNANPVCGSGNYVTCSGSGVCTKTIMSVAALGCM